MPAKRSVKERWVLITIALFIALLLEVYFYSADNSVTANIAAMVEVRNLPLDKMIIEPPKGEKGIPVRLEVRGPRPLVEQVRSSANRFLVAMPPTDPAEFTAFLDPHQLKLPAGVEVLGITPPSITIKTEQIAQKELLIELERVGKPAPGFEVESATLQPSTVIVRGPQSRVEALKSIATYPVDVSHLRASARFDTSLQVPDSLVVLGVGTVKVDIAITALREERVFDNIGIRVLAGDGFAATASPSRAQVVLSGPIDEIKRLRGSEVMLIADGRTLPEGRHRVALGGEFGPNIRIERTVPAEVNVTLVTREHG